MRHATAIIITLCVLALPSTGRAQDGSPRLVIPSFADDITANAVAMADEPAAQTPRPVAIEYSEGYETRAKIHKYASFATLPLFVTEYAIGQSLYTNSTRDARRTAHGAVGVAIGGLFGVNSVTGVWNMWDSRKDPHGRTRRMIHGLLMLSADAGFVATSASAPNGGRSGALTYTANAQTHRTIAITSMAIATAGYLTMLFGGR